MPTKHGDGERQLKSRKRPAREYVPSLWMSRSAVKGTMLAQCMDLSSLPLYDGSVNYESTKNDELAVPLD